jgi:hypothetical protein
MHQVYRTADFEIGWGYVKQVEIVGDDRSTRRNRLGVASRSICASAMSDPQERAEEPVRQVAVPVERAGVRATERGQNEAPRVELVHDR